MRRRLVLTLALLLVAVSSQAQTATYKLGWDFTNALLADVQQYATTVKFGTAAPIATTPTCTQNGTTVSCITVPLPGPFVAPVVVTVSNAFGSTSSAPLNGSAPGSPINVKVTVTVTVP